MTSMSQDGIDPPSPRPGRQRAIRRSAAFVAAIAAAAPAAADGPGFTPGSWTHQTRMISAEVPGVPDLLIRMFAGHRTRRSCLTAQQAATAPQALLTQDDAATCRLRRFSMAAGRFDYVTFCTNRRFPDGLTITSTGAYSPGAYTMHSTAVGTKDGKPVRIATEGSGQRTGACR